MVCFVTEQAVTRVKLGEYFASKISSLKMSLVCFRVDGEKGKAERGNSALKALKDAFLLLQGYFSDLTISIVRPGLYKSCFQLVNFLYLFNCSVMNSS